MSHYKQQAHKYTLNKDMKIVIVRAEFNDSYTRKLSLMNQEFLYELWFKNVEMYTVPWAYEIPAFSKKIANSQDIDLILCFWVVVRGDTSHYDHVANECFRGLMDLSLSCSSSIINGVLTCENFEQVEERMSTTYAISGLNLLEELKKI